MRFPPGRVLEFVHSFMKVEAACGGCLLAPLGATDMTHRMPSRVDLALACPVRVHCVS